MAEFLLEIGFEEMPAPWLSGLADQLSAKFTSLANDEQLAPAKVRVQWTSRRLVLVADVKARQDDRSVVEWGPAGKIAKDAAGNWSKAAEGFAKKQGVALDQLSLAAKTPGSSDLYLTVTRQIPGRPTADVLASLLPSILRGFNFAKRMNWDAWLDDGRGGFEFGRPIQWIVTLLDGEIVPLSIYDAVVGAKGAARVVAGRRSMGNRFYPRSASDRGFDVRSFAELEAGLAARFVVLDPARRAERIKAQITTAGSSVTGDAAHLAHEWVDLVEYPTVVVGSIPPEFADLPDEVLETVLAHHQKALTLPRAKDGSPRFAAISGCDEAGAKNAAQGQERVVIARLKDARFFYYEDRKRTLESRVEDLSTVTFQKGLGTYKEKALRVSALARALARQGGLEQPLIDAAGRAGLLAKADLVTLMVREFPELQGTIGGLYATSEDSSVALAIKHHYLPTEIYEGQPPDRDLQGAPRGVFAAVSMADKLDTLVAYIATGVVPTGSADPFGLRRAAQGVIRLLLDFWPSGSSSLRDFVDFAVDNFFHTIPGVFPRGDQIRTPENAARTAGDLRTFLAERLRTVLVARPQFFTVPAGRLAAVGNVSHDVVDSVLSARVSALHDVRGAQNRLKALISVRAAHWEQFAALAESFKRAKNIVGESPAGEVDETLFVEDAESRLLSAIRRAEAASASDPAARLRAVADLRGEVDSFFKRVMVNADDPKLKANRLALLSRLLNLVYEVADLSKLASLTGDSATSS